MINRFIFLDSGETAFRNKEVVVCPIIVDGRNFSDKSIATVYFTSFHCLKAYSSQLRH